MKPNQQKPPVSKPIRIIQILMVLTALAIPITIVAWMMWHGSPKEILAVADKFKPQEGWVLIHEEVRPPANACIDLECPQVVREWKLPRGYTSEEIISMLRSGYGGEALIHADDDCQDDTDEANIKIESCFMSLKTDKNHLEIYQKIDKSDSMENKNIVLLIFFSEIK